MGWGSSTQRTAKGASGKGQRQQKSSKKMSKIFSTLFDIFRAGQKNVKKTSKYLSTIFARHRFSGPFWGALIHVRGWGPKVRHVAQNPGTKLFGGISRDFGWDIAGAPEEKFEKKRFVFSNFGP